MKRQQFSEVKDVPETKTKAVVLSVMSKWWKIGYRSDWVIEEQAIISYYSLSIINMSINKLNFGWKGCEDIDDNEEIWVSGVSCRQGGGSVSSWPGSGPNLEKKSIPYLTLDETGSESDPRNH